MELVQLIKAYNENRCNKTYAPLHEPLYNYIKRVLTYHRVDHKYADELISLVVESMERYPYHHKENVETCLHTSIMSHYKNLYKQEIRWKREVPLTEDHDFAKEGGFYADGTPECELDESQLDDITYVSRLTGKSVDNLQESSKWRRVHWKN